MKLRKTALLLTFTLLFNTTAFGSSENSSAYAAAVYPFAADETASPSSDETVSPVAVKLELDCVSWTPYNGACWQLKNRNIKCVPKYIVNLYKNGTLQKEYQLTDSHNYDIIQYYYNSFDINVDFNEEMKKDPSGEYTFDVTAIGDGTETLNSDTVKIDTVYLYKEPYYSANIYAAAANSGIIELLLMNSAIPYVWYCDYDESFFEKISQANITQGIDIPGGESGDLINLRPIKSGSTEISFVFRDYSPESTPYDNVTYKIDIDENMIPTVSVLDPTAEYSFGDADADGMLTSADAAVILQKVLTDSYTMPLEEVTEYYMAYLDVDRDFSLTAADAAMIMQKVMTDSTVMPVEAEYARKSEYLGGYALDFESTMLSYNNDSDYFYGNGFFPKNDAKMITSANELDAYCQAEDIKGKLNEEKFKQHLYDTFGKDVFKIKNIVLLSTTTPSIADKLKVTRVLSKNKALKLTLNAVAPEVYPDALDGRIAAICIDKSRYGDISVETDHYLTENGKSVFFYNVIWQ